MFTRYFTAQPNCVNSFYSSQDIINQSLLITCARTIQDRRQFFFPDMKFKCNGTINKWIYGGLTSENILPELQIWRETVGDTYIKHAFSQVIANETEPGSNVHEYFPTTPIEFMEGDVFGIFQPSDANVALYSQRESGPDNYRVRGNANILVLGELRIEGGDNDYPLVSLEIMGMKL